MNFFEKNLQNLTGVIQRSLFTEHLARQDGVLQKLDPRTKIVCGLIMLLMINSTHYISLLTLVYCLSLGIAYASKIPLYVYITRVWLFLPFFTGLIALPALFNIVTPGNIVLSLGFLSISDAGLRVASLLLVRVATSVSIVLLVVATTSWIHILKSLEILRFPKIFVAIVLMTYRYIFVLTKTTDTMLLARRSRMVGIATRQEQTGWGGRTIGSLFMKTYSLSDQVYMAMISRGYRNHIEIMHEFTFRWYDWSAVFFIVVCMSLLFIFVR